MYLTPLQRKQQEAKSSPLFIDLVAGIDPDVSRSGWAMWSRSRNCIVEVYNLTFDRFLVRLDLIRPGTVLFVVDAGWLNDPVNFHDPHVPERMKNASKEAIAKYVAKQREKVAHDVGQNSGVGRTISHMIRVKGHDEHLIEFCPKIPKWDKDMIARQTGYTGISNPETRDAIRDAWLHK